MYFHSQQKFPDNNPDKILAIFSSLSNIGFSTEIIITLPRVSPSFIIEQKE